MASLLYSLIKKLRDEGFLEYINNVLSSGEVSNLFARDEIDEINSALIPVMKKEFPRAPTHSRKPLRLLSHMCQEEPPCGTLLLSSGREIPQPLAQVPRSVQRLYNGLVQSVAEGRPHCRGTALPGLLQHRLLPRGQGGSGAGHGHLPGLCGRELHQLF